MARQDSIEGGIKFRTSTYASKATLAKLKDLAAERDVAVSVIIRETIDEALNGAEFVTPSECSRSLCFLISDEVADEVKAIAEDRGIGMATVLRCMIEAGLARR